VNLQPRQDGRTPSDEAYRLKPCTYRRVLPMQRLFRNDPLTTAICRYITLVTVSLGTPHVAGCYVHQSIVQCNSCRHPTISSLASQAGMVREPYDPLHLQLHQHHPKAFPTALYYSPKWSGTSTFPICLKENSLLYLCAVLPRHHDISSEHPESSVKMHVTSRDAG
jgi:hypothetical protein